MRSLAWLHVAETPSGPPELGLFRLVNVLLTCKMQPLGLPKLPGRTGTTLLVSQEKTSSFLARWGLLFSANITHNSLLLGGPVLSPSPMLL